MKVLSYIWYIMKRLFCRGISNFCYLIYIMIQIPCVNVIFNKKIRNLVYLILREGETYY
jgi:hypothetical protein